MGTEGATLKSLTAQVTELRRINTILEADLAALRQAHAEDIANLAGAGTSVTALFHGDGASGHSSLPIVTPPRGTNLSAGSGSV